MISKPVQQARNIHGIVLILAAIMPVMAIVSVVPIMPLLGREFAQVPNSAVLIPIALTVPALCVALFSPIAGWLSDRVGRKTLLISALFGYSIVGVLPFFLIDLKQIIAARVCLGFFEAVIMTIATALIGDYFKGDMREKWIGVQIAAISISAIFLIAIGGAMGSVIGSRGPFLLYLLAMPIAFLVMWKIFEPEVIEKNNDTGGDMPWKSIAPILITTLVVGVFFYTALVKLGDILLLSGDVSPGFIGGVGALFNIGVMFAALIFMNLKTKPSALKLLAIGMLSFASGYIGMGLSSTITFTIIFVFITSLGAGLLMPVMLAWIMNILPINVRGRGTGLWTGMFFLGQFIAPLVAVAFANLVGGLSNVLLFYGVLASILMIIAVIYARSAQRLM